MFFPTLTHSSTVGGGSAPSLIGDQSPINKEEKKEDEEEQILLLFTVT